MPEQSTHAPQELERPSLYRRHRPRTFADVVGQEAIVQTLRGAVQRDAVHHAYLFVGSRGTGKTSMAKILAACLNCARGRTVEPCGRCESCVSIARASSLDVIEMDAASNNSVDDIRGLRESVAYAPVSGGTKVYILDEAHMLSTAAWNAFLKTLEEPPPSTVFVLATTDAAKVPATVVDRCHRFDFGRPTAEQLATVVRRTAQAESIAIGAEAVTALARAAAGSFRDALGTLEQLVAYSGREIALEDVLAVLGVADGQLLDETFDAVQTGDARAVLLAVAACAEQGRDAGAFAADLEARARELLIVQTLGEVPREISLTAETDTRLAAQAQRVERAVVVRVLELLGDALEAARAGADARTRLELALVKAARPELDSSVRALTARIERLERGLAGIAPAVALDDGGGVGVSPQAAVLSSSGHATSTWSPEDDVPPAVGVRPSEDAIRPAEQATQPADGAAEPGETPDPSRPPVCDASSLDALRELWPAVVDSVRSSNALLAAAIADAWPVALVDGELTVAFGEDAAFMKKKAEDAANRTLVVQALGELTGVRLQLVYELRERLADDTAPPARLTQDEWITRFVEEFDAEELLSEPSKNQRLE